MLNIEEATAVSCSDDCSTKSSCSYMRRNSGTLETRSNTNNGPLGLGPHRELRHAATNGTACALRRGRA
ncbi:MAG TPA: hypothetical protein VGG99_21965 [Acetobacteraceae bacterium]